MLAKIIILKRILLGSFSSRNFCGFYRTKPFAHNLLTIALECWHLQLTLLAVTTRFAKFVVVIILYLGRFDRPILMDDISLDNAPFWYRHLILSTEAHHHPYIERLGLMYMMRLRYGDRFGRKSGSTWRLLFVFALMPWLQKYRIKNNEIDKDEIRRLMMLNNKSVKCLLG